MTAHNELHSGDPDDPQRKWLCPRCASTGVSGSLPVCRKEGCDGVFMVAISDLAYNRIGVWRRDANEYDQNYLHAKAAALREAAYAFIPNDEHGWRAWMHQRADEIEQWPKHGQPKPLLDTVWTKKRHRAATLYVRVVFETRDDVKVASCEADGQLRSPGRQWWVSKNGHGGAEGFERVPDTEPGH